MKKPYVTNLVTKSDLYNLSSITSTNTLLNKFQICLGKLNDYSTKDIAFTDIKKLIKENKNDPNSLRYYLSALNINTKSTKTSNSAKEIHALIYGFISKTYQYDLYDSFDKPPNLIKTINRMLTQIRNKYLEDSTYSVHKACAFSYSEILINSMPKEDIPLIIIVFFDPILNLISTGGNKNVQEGATIILCDLIETIGSGQIEELVITDYNNGNKNILEIIANKVINQLLKGPVSDNFYILDALYKLMSYVKFENFNYFLKELYNRLLLIMNQKNFNYKGIINTLNIFSLIADKLMEPKNRGIGYFQKDILDSIKNMTTDRVHKVQIVAKETLNKWKIIEDINKKEDEGKELFFDEDSLEEENKNDNVDKINNNINNNKIKNSKTFFQKENKYKTKFNKGNIKNDPFKYAYIDERDYKIKNIVNKVKERNRYKNLFNDNNNNNIQSKSHSPQNFNNRYSMNEQKEYSPFNIIKDNINKNNSTNNSNLNNDEEITLNEDNRHYQKNNTIEILKLTLSNLINTSLTNMQNTFFDSMNFRLNKMDEKLANIETKLNVTHHKQFFGDESQNSSFVVINNERILNKNAKSISSNKRENLSSDKWKISLDFVEKNNLNDAYKNILLSSDDIYLLRLVFLTGPVINILQEDIAIKVLMRINMINRGQQIQNILINLISQCLNDKRNIFNYLTYEQKNDILDSLYQIFGDENTKNNNIICQQAKILYNAIIENNKNQ